MLSFTEFIEERYLNFLHQDKETKNERAEEVYALLQKAYAPIGGIHGSGFNSAKDMIENIPMWKLNVKNSKLVAVAMYKDRGGRKRVAVATDGSAEGKKALAEIMRDDVKRFRAYNEVSGPSLGFLKKNVDNVAQFAIPLKDVPKHLDGTEIRPAPADDPEVKKHPDLKDKFYQRQIGKEWHTKIMLGTAGIGID